MVRVCVIGAGPSGMAFLAAVEQQRTEGKENLPEVVCYEKQATWGGMWNYTWKTGMDENGEMIHASMYRYLWCNGPKEGLELPDYTYQEHFKKPIPSYVSREVLLDYQEGRWNKYNLKNKVTYNTTVRKVIFNDDSGKFEIATTNLATDTANQIEHFDYLINCSGHFSVPNIPKFIGLDEFPGRVMHAHEFRDANEFQGKRILVVGSSYSGEDIAIQCLKYGVGEAIISYRTTPLEYTFPPQIRQRPLLTKAVGKQVFFADGTSDEVDAIILATGYKHCYPFLEDRLRLKGDNLLYPPNLYRGTVWAPKEGFPHGKMLYVGGTDQVFSFPLFTSQGFWALKYILGEIEMPSYEDVLKDNQKWRDRLATLSTFEDMANFQTDHVALLNEESDYPYRFDRRNIGLAWQRDRKANIMTYRDKTHTSHCTNITSSLHRVPFMEEMDDSFETFVGRPKNSVPQN